MKLRWLLFATGLVLVSIGAYGLLTGRPWSNIINVLFTLLGLTISLAQVFFRFPVIDLSPPTNSSLRTSMLQVATYPQKPAEAARPPLPRDGVMWAIIIGCIAGIIGVVEERYMYAIIPYIRFLDFDIDLGTTPLTGERAQAILRGRPRGRLGLFGSGKGCLRGRPRGRFGSACSQTDAFPRRRTRLGSTQAMGAPLY